MLFDLQGKRRRVVQATYLTLALLMGGGLVLFGIGGDVAGGLFDAFSERGGGGGDVVEEQRERVDDAEKDLAKNPADVEALDTVVNGHIALANAERSQETLTYSLKGRSELFEAASAWERYLAAKPETPDGEVADRVVDVYALLGEYKKAADTAEVVTKSLPSVEAWLTLAQFATWAKDKEKAKAAGDKAIELAADDEREDVEQQVKQVLKSKAPPQAPAEPQPGEGGSGPFQQPGQEGAPGGGGAPPGGAPGGSPPPPPPGQ